MYTSFIESQGLNKVSEASGESEDYEGDHGDIHSQFECHVNYVMEKDREENELVLGCNTWPQCKYLALSGGFQDSRYDC